MFAVRTEIELVNVAVAVRLAHCQVVLFVVSISGPVETPVLVRVIVFLCVRVEVVVSVTAPGLVGNYVESNQTQCSQDMSEDDAFLAVFQREMPGINNSLIEKTSNIPR